ncbi:MAG: DedA family protein [Muribaculaceae bacterium]|nr:DedA family protein [Muribaculaceae bacterium]
MIFDVINLAIFDASSFFQWFMENASYLFVFVFMVIESTFVPFPSEVVVPPAAYLAAHDDSSMNIYLIVLVATAGAIVGALINYYLSLWLGRPIIYKFAESRVGHMFLLNKEKVDRAEDYFNRHGAVSTFIGRLIPVIRQLISIPAGLARMNIVKFVAFTGLGAGLWNAVLAGLGYLLSRMVTKDELFGKVEQYNSYLTYFGLAILAVCVAYIAWNFFKPRKTKIEQ